MIQGEKKSQEFSVDSVGCEVPVSHLNKDIEWADEHLNLELKGKSKLDK